MIESPNDWWKLWIQARGDILMIADGVGMKPNEIQKTLGEQSLSAVLNLATLNNEWKTVHTFLESLWGRAPDSPIIHTWDGWAELCDLCSEIWVHDPQELYRHHSGGD